MQLHQEFLFVLTENIQILIGGHHVVTSAFGDRETKFCRIGRLDPIHIGQSHVDRRIEGTRLRCHHGRGVEDGAVREDFDGALIHQRVIAVLEINVRADADSTTLHLVCAHVVPIRLHDVNTADIAEGETLCASAGDAKDTAEFATQIASETGGYKCS